MAVRQITVREYERLSILEAPISKGDKALSVQEAESLFRLSESFPVRAVERHYRSVRFLNYCGVIQLGQLTLEILPKIASADTGQLDRLLLLRMLSQAHNLPLAEIGQANTAFQTHQLLEIFIAYFCQESFRQLHKGLIHRYEDHEETLPFIRGQWLIHKDLNQNAGRQDRIHCKFDHFTDDNPYNQAIKACIRLLYRCCPPQSRQNQKLRLLSAAFSHISDQHITAATVRALPKNRLVSRYRPLLQLCEWFLSEQSPNLHAGQNTALALLFNMNQLFEKFIASILASVLPKGFHLKTQGPITHLALNKQTPCCELRPDISIFQANHSWPSIIIDTKWKQPEKQGIQASDIYQLKIYADAYQCNNVALWYPLSALTQQSLAADLSFLTADQQLTGQNLHIRQIELQSENQTNAGWKNQMQKHIWERLQELLPEADKPPNPYPKIAFSTLPL